MRFPTAIDVGDGVWWDDLGIRGDRAVVEVTFLWLGSDPLAQPAGPAPPAAAEPPPPPPAAEPAPEPPAAEPAPPPPAAEPAPEPPPAVEPAPEPPPEPEAKPLAATEEAPAAQPPAPAEVIVDERGSSFKGHAAIKWYDGPGGCGEGGSALWTYTTTDAGASENHGRWQPALPAEALYDVYVAIPSCAGRKPNTSSARYLIQHRDGASEVTVDQAGKAGGWVLLGRFPFSAGEGGAVELRDVSGDSMRTIWFDAVKWVRVP